MRPFSSIRQVLAASVLVSFSLLFPQIARAQVGFIADLILSHLCMIQNWDTPNMQSWLSKMPRQQRMHTFSSVKFSPAVRRCLMTAKSAPVALCDRVLEGFVEFQAVRSIGGTAPFQSLTDAERDQIFQALNQSPCDLHDDLDETIDWVPDDLKPSAETLKLLELAKSGDKAAQLKAFELYTEGTDVPPSVIRADYWLTQAALSGDANAQYHLGWKYDIGKDPHSVDAGQAIRFFSMAASQGHRDAMTRLAFVYKNDPFDDEPEAAHSIYARKPHKDMAKAISWFIKAANLGDSFAAYMLAEVYGRGDHVPVDMTKAFFWYQKSAQGQYMEAMLKLAEFYQAGKGSAKDVEAAQQWRRKASALGSRSESLIHYFPWGEQPRDAAAIFSLQLNHAKAGDVNAQLAVAARYSHGEGVKEDDKEAITWWRKAAMTGDPIGQRMLGHCLMDAKQGIDSVDSEAISWLRKADAQGDAAAGVSLAYWYVKKVGETVEEKKQNRREAIRLMRQAADRGYEPEESRERADLWEAILADG